VVGVGEPPAVHPQTPFPGIVVQTFFRFFIHPSTSLSVGSRYPTHVPVVTGRPGKDCRLWLRLCQCCTFRSMAANEPAGGTRESEKIIYI
jgi:hypothetical protein